MAMPRFHELFDEVLAVLADGNVHHRRDLMNSVVSAIELTDEERLETMSGGGNRARSRVHWALEYLCQAGAARRPKRGYAEITELGRKLLQEHPNGVPLKVLEQTDGFQQWKLRSKQGKGSLDDSSSPQGILDSGSGTPMEQIESALKIIEASVATQLLDRLRIESPEFLEKIVLRVLHAMGYGDSTDDLQHLGGVGDGGVDGVIRQDKLGLDEIYVQAKRYNQGTVGRPEIQSFIGALTGKHASRGVFITTGSFTKDARDFAKTIPNFRVVLIDGEELVTLMIHHKVGVTVERSLGLVGMDENFFTDE